MHKDEHATTAKETPVTVQGLRQNLVAFEGSATQQMNAKGERSPQRPLYGAKLALEERMMSSLKNLEQEGMLTDNHLALAETIRTKFLENEFWDGTTNTAGVQIPQTGEPPTVKVAAELLGFLEPGFSGMDAREVSETPDGHGFRGNIHRYTGRDPQWAGGIKATIEGSALHNVQLNSPLREITFARLSSPSVK